MTIGQIKQFTTGGAFQCLDNGDLTVISANDSFYSFIGYSKEEFLQSYASKLKSLAFAENPCEVFEYIQLQIQKNQSFSIDLKVVSSGGVSKWMWINADMLQNDKGENYLNCIFSDITMQKAEQEQLKTIQQRYQFVLDNIEDIIFEWNYKTKEMFQMGGTDIDFTYKATLKNFPDDLAQKSRNLHPDDRLVFLNNYHKYDFGAKNAYAEYRIRDKSGIYFWFATSSVGVFENGELVKVMGRISNINDQKLQLLEMSRKAMRDPLTELYNRKATESLVNQYIDSTENMAAMMIIDLDNFKLVNDILGHLQGDNVLNEIAEKIKSGFRDTDIIGRVGGDEFVVFMTDIHDIEIVRRTLEKILVHFQKTLESFDVGSKLSGSMGIAIYPKDARTYSELLDKADIALYHAKNTGKNKYVIYDDEFAREGSTAANHAHERIKRTPNESQKKEDLYKLALTKTNVIAWVYDIKNGCIQRVLTPSYHLQAHISYANFPQDLIDKGYVHPDSISPLLEMHSKLSQGEKEVCAEICTMDAENKTWDWQQIAYTTVFDEDGVPEVAVGTSKNISDKKNAQIKYKYEAERATVLGSGVVCVSITNLTKNIVERYRHCENENITETQMNGYEDVMKTELAAILNAEDIKRYGLITREYLSLAFENGESHLWLELRRKTVLGQLIWVSVSFSLLRDAKSGDIYAYAIMRDINSQKRQELSLSSSAKTDEVTGAYEQQTARELIDTSIKMSHDNQDNFALIAFSVDRYSKIVDCDGERLAQDVMLELSSLIQHNFTNQIVGRLFGDQLLVLVREIDLSDAVVNTVNTVISTAQSSPDFSSCSIPVTISAGIVFKSEGTTDFNSTYRYAEIALDTAKKSGYGRCVVYTGKAAQQDNINALAASGGTNAGDTILRCSVSLSELDNKAKGIATILNEMGQYYDADKIFVLDFLEANDYPQNCHTWSNGVTTVTAMQQGYEAKAFCPYIFDYLEKNPIGIFDDVSVLKDSYFEDYNILCEKGINSLFTAIVKSGNDRIGYVALINPKINVEDSLLFTTLHRFLSGEMEKRQLHEKRKFLDLHDPLTSLFNRNKYSEYSRLLKEESLISLGAVSVDINGLKRLNTQKGHAAGDLAVADVAAVLSKVFAGYDCYRFSGDEFLVLCENISRESLVKKVKELKHRFKEFANFSVSVGCAWSDIDIKLEVLVQHSDEKMMSEKQEYYLKSESKARNYDPSERTKLLSEIKSDYYVMFLQPKLSAQTGEISGAEALVRFIDLEKTIVYPDKFVPRYEANGLIKYIDLLIMEKVCQTLRRWIDEGKNPVCLSLNLSRATILVGNVVAELCRIADSYCVPRHLVEIEITESFGDLERGAITNVGKQICAAGFKLSLDDFGAKYSNLSILSAATWDTLKVDKSLVNDIFSNNNTQIILKKLFELCRELGIMAVSEGVETREQYQMLMAMGCDDIQGYYFNKPMPLADFEKEYIKNK